MLVDRCRRSSNTYTTNPYQLPSSTETYTFVVERSVSSSSLNSLSSSSDVSSGSGSSSSGVVSGERSIVHYVSKMDTLAGVAIKYGVEVADIKKMNGLVTDLQMFALKTLQIPLPGRHPPSPGLSNSSTNQGENCIDQTISRRVHSGVLDSLQSLKSTSPPKKISMAMSTLQGYYGLQSLNNNYTEEDTEMSVYRKDSAHYSGDEQYPTPSSLSEPPPSRHRQTRSLMNSAVTENGELTNNLPPVTESGESKSDRWNFEKIFRRRQKNEVRTSETIIKNQDSNGGSGLSSRTGKGLALRPKSSGRIALTADSDSGWLNPIPIGLGDNILANGFDYFRKSSGISNLQEQEDPSAYSIRANSKWSLKPDVIAKPIFDGLPKPINPRRNKAALD